MVESYCVKCKSPQTVNNVKYEDKKCEMKKKDPNTKKRVKTGKIIMRHCMTGTCGKCNNKIIKFTKKDNNNNEPVKKEPVVLNETVLKDELPPIKIKKYRKKKNIDVVAV